VAASVVVLASVELV
jgi:hypothetical protein